MEPLEPPTRRTEGSRSSVAMRVIDSSTGRQSGYSVESGLNRATPTAFHPLRFAQVSLHFRRTDREPDSLPQPLPPASPKGPFPLLPHHSQRTRAPILVYRSPFAFLLLAPELLPFSPRGRLSGRWEGRWGRGRSGSTRCDFVVPLAVKMVA